MTKGDGTMRDKERFYYFHSELFGEDIAVRKTPPYDMYTQSGVHYNGDETRLMRENLQNKQYPELVHILKKMTGGEITFIS